MKAFERLNCFDTGVMNIKSAREADLHKNLQRLEKCDAVLFTGGDQEKLCKLFLGTKFLKRLKERYKNEDDFLISGTSAGAMSLGRVTIVEDDPEIPFVKGHIDIIRGFGLLPDIVVDTHFIQRRRLGRLVE